VTAKPSRIDFLIPEEEIEFLRTQSGSLSSHIRTAIRDYTRKLRGMNVSTSASRKEEENG